MMLIVKICVCVWVGRGKALSFQSEGRGCESCLGSYIHSPKISNTSCTFVSSGEVGIFLQTVD